MAEGSGSVMAGTGPIGRWKQRIPDGLRAWLPSWIEEPAYRFLRWLYRDRLEVVDIRHPEVAFEMLAPPVAMWRDHEATGNHEPPVTTVVARLLRDRPRTRFWDVGSRYGYYPVLAATVTDRPGNVHVFEPDDRHARIIAANDARYLDDDLNLHVTMLGRRDGDGMIRGDTVAESIGPPDLVKIDVDGAEVEVLEGLQGTLREHRPVLMLEVHLRPEPYDERRAAVARILAEAGYRLRLCREHRTPKAGWEPIAPDELPDGPWGDKTDYMLLADVADGERDVTPYLG